MFMASRPGCFLLPVRGCHDHLKKICYLNLKRSACHQKDGVKIHLLDLLDGLTLTETYIKHRLIRDLYEGEETKGS